MLGRKDRDQPELFVTGSLRQLVPDDHILARVDRVLDVSWLRAEVADLYCPDNGRPGIDPEVAVRLMLAGFLLGIVHDRRLMREASGQPRHPLVRRLRPARDTPGPFLADPHPPALGS
jgi:transposase